MGSGEADYGRKLVGTAVNLAVDGAAMEVVRSFKATGVPCILLKGPSLGDWLYGPGADRYSTDVDLLVAPRNLLAAEEVLGQLGYVPLVPVTRSSDRPRYARVWRRESGRADVDLHTTLAGIGTSGDNAWAVLAGETEQLVIGRVRAEVLAPGARALHVALHAAKHGPGHAKALDDLERAVARLPLDVWHEAAALAVRLEAEPALAAGLTLVPGGRELVERLGLSERLSVEVALRAQTAPPLALGVDWFSSLPGPRAKARFVLDKVAPPPAFMRRWHPLARRGPPGLAAAYVYRLAWLGLKLPRALAVWRRAKRASARPR